jgi:hypothetical protein
MEFQSNSTQLSHKNRSTILDRMESEVFDLVIIGGGITG